MKPILLFLALTVPLSARIGETMEQCVKRYGQATDSHPRFTEFKKSDLVIWVTFLDSVGARISYKWESPDDQKPFSKEMIKSLLDANGEWDEPPKIHDGDIWESKDGKLRAAYDETWKTLIISTTAMIEKEEADRKAADMERIKGL